MLQFLKDAFIMVWFISFIAFIIYWRKKVNAKKSAGEKYKDDENYQQISKFKRIIGIVCLASFVLGTAIPESPESKAERIAREQQRQVERTAQNEQKVAEKTAKEAEKQEKARLEAEEKAAAEANKYVEIDIDTLINAAQNNAAAANKNYKGKYLKVVGGILDHVESDGDYILVSNGDITLLHLQCFPKNKEAKNQIFNLSNGQYVTIYGKVTRVGGIIGYDIDMDKIE